MGLARLQQITSNYSGAASTSHAVPVDANCSADGSVLLFLICAGNRTFTVTDSQGNTWTQRSRTNAGTTHSSAIWETQQDVAPLTDTDTITVGISASIGLGARGYEYAGGAASWFDDNAEVGNGASGVTTFDSTDATPTEDGGMAIGFLTFANTPGTITVDDPFDDATLVSSAWGPPDFARKGYVYEQRFRTAAAHGMSGSYTTARQNTAHVAVFKDTPAVGDVVQSKSALVLSAATTAQITLDATPTDGNMLVLIAAHREANNDNINPSDNGTWTLIEDVQSSGVGTWPHKMWYQQASGSSATTTVSHPDTTGQARELVLVELQGPLTFDTFVSTNNTSDTEEPITPEAGKVAALVSSVYNRTDSGPLLEPSADSFELEEASRVEVAHRWVPDTSGSYTIGAPGASGNSSFIGASFVEGTAADTALAGSSAGTSTAAGVLTTQITLVGSSSGVGSAAAVLTTEIALVGSSAGVATALGVLSSASDTALAGSSAGTSTAEGVLTTQIRLAGSSAGLASALGDLTTAITLVGQSTGQSAAAAALTTAIALAGSSAGVGSAVGDLTTAIRLAGSSAGVGSAVGVLGSVSIPGNARATVALVAAPTATASAVAIQAAVAAMVETTGAAVAVVPIGSGVVALVAIPSAEVS